MVIVAVEVEDEGAGEEEEEDEGEEEGEDVGEEEGEDEDEVDDGIMHEKTTNNSNARQRIPFNC